MARYIFMSKESALEKGLIVEDTARLISKDGKTVCLLEDDLLKLGNDKEAIISSLDCEVMEHKYALRKIESEF